MHPDIVACARGWLGTRFHHQGRLKKTATHRGGVDCLGLLIGVADELAITLPDGTPLAHQDKTDYSHYPDTQALREELDRLLLPVPGDSLEPGDVLLMNVDDNPQHLGIVSEIPGATGLIHAYAPARAVVEHVLSSWWRERIVQVYRIRN